MTGRIYKGILPFYDSEGLSTKDSDFSAKYSKMVESVEKEFNDNYVEKAVKFLREYPKVELDDILNNRIKISKGERKDKINNIEEIIQYIEDYGNNPKDYLLQPKQREKLSDLLYTLKSKTDKYRLEVFAQNDPIKKMSNWASKVEICWSEEERNEYPKRYINDIRENGGTIIFCVKSGKTPAVFGRSFIGRDRNNRIYLFIDNIEGKGYRHLIGSWAEEEPGAFKLALAAEFFFAEKMGCEYLVAGDEGVEETFVSIGTSKRNVSVSGKNIKIGYKAACFSPNENELKALSFYQDKYHYISLL